MNNPPPRNQYLQDLNNREIYDKLYDAAPNLNLGWIRFGGRDLTSQEIDEALKRGIDPDKIAGRDFFSFGKWKAFDEIRPKEYQLRAQIPAQLAAEDYNRRKEDRTISRQQSIQREDREDRQKFELNLNTQNINARAKEIQEQGKLNMRQSMLNSVNERRLAILSNPLKVLA